jgi:hypothetical protein
MTARGPNVPSGRTEYEAPCEPSQATGLRSFASQSLARSDHAGYGSAMPVPSVPKAGERHTELFREEHFADNDECHYQRRLRVLHADGWQLVSLHPSRLGVVALFVRVAPPRRALRIVR